jgi:hypothetical protein
MCSDTCVAESPKPMAKPFERPKPCQWSASFGLLLSLSRLGHHPQQFLLHLFQAKLSLFAGCAVHPRFTLAVSQVRLIHSL